MSDIKSQVPPEAFERVRALLEASVPGGPAGTPSYGHVTDAGVSAFISALWRGYTPDQASAFASLGLPVPPQAVTAPAAAPRPSGSSQAISYYAVASRHHRLGVSQFTATLPMVRVSLPNEADDWTIHTDIGDISSRDHLVRNLRDVVSKAWPCERVEMVVPARREGTRFAAIGVILCYAKFADALPAYYILEAGLAQGSTRMLYISRDMTPIVRRADYQATPMSHTTNFYRGTLNMAGNEPKELVIEAFQSGNPKTDPTAQPYNQINAVFEKVAATDKRLDKLPFDLYKEAILRIAAVCNVFGVKITLAGPFQGLLANEGLKLPWLNPPAAKP